MSPEHLEIFPQAKHFRFGSARMSAQVSRTPVNAFTFGYRGTEVLLMLRHPDCSSWCNSPIVEMGPTDLG